MFLATADLRRITQDVWSSLLGLELTAAEVPTAETEPLVTGRVAIFGDWSGDVTVQCTDRLARRAAGQMFGGPLEQLADADVHDTVGELANITGGNVKSLMSAGCHLSLPAVTLEVPDPAETATVLDRIASRFEGELLLVTVHRDAASAGPAGRTEVGS